MRRRIGFSRMAVLAAAAAVMAACQNGVTGPSLSATVQNLSSQRTVAGLVGGENVCCCHIAGQLTNTSSIGVHAEVLFTARNSSGQAVGTALNIQRDVAAGASRSFLAVGIAAACKDVSLAQINQDKVIRLKGLWEPE